MAELLQIAASHRVCCLIQPSVRVAKGYVKHQEGLGKSIDHLRQNDSRPSVQSDIPPKPGKNALVSEEIHQAQSVNHRGKEKRDQSHISEKNLPSDPGSGDPISIYKSQKRSQHR